MRTSRTDRWQRCFNALQQYVERTGVSVASANHYEMYEGENVAIGAWVSYNRQQYRAGLLSNQRQKDLESLLGWHWDKKKPGRRYDVQRDSNITARRSDGEKIGVLASEFNLSRQRVHQIIKKSVVVNV